MDDSFHINILSNTAKNFSLQGDGNVRTEPMAHAIWGKAVRPMSLHGDPVSMKQALGRIWPQCFQELCRMSEKNSGVKPMTSVEGWVECDCVL